jgi:O-antigen ligase
LAKVYVAGGGLALAFAERRAPLMRTTLAALSTFAIVFLVRRFIYQEVDEETLRPILKTTHGDPNFIASLLVAGLPLVAFTWLTHFENRRRWRACLAIGTAALFLAVIVLTESRMALISLAIISMALLARIKWPVSRTKIVVTLATCLALAGAFGGSQVLDRFSDMADDSNQDRVKSIENGIVMFGERPWLGHGMHSSWQHFYKNSGYGPLEDESRNLDIHNAPVQILAELGLFGLAVHGALVLFLLTTLRQARRDDALLVTFAGASLLSLAINMLSLPMAHQYIFHQWLILVAVIVSTHRGTQSAA